MNHFQGRFSNIDHWCSSQGWIEIGQDDYSHSLVRALDEGGKVWESKGSHKTIDQH